MGSQLKRSRGKRQPQKVGSQPERLQMAWSTVKEGSLCERIALGWSGRKISAKQILHSDLAPIGLRKARFVSAFHQTGRHKVNDPKVGLKRRLREGKVGHEPRLEPCWTLLVIGSLVQCEPDEPSWTWTQTWVQARMSDYILNWTTMSCAILAGQWLFRTHPAKRPRGTQDPEIGKRLRFMSRKKSFQVGFMKYL